MTSLPRRYWDDNEMVLGVLGLAPYATLDFMQKLYDAVPAQKDWEYPRVLLDINTKIPSRGRAYELGEEDPSPYIRDGIIKLHKQGAGCVAIPCNTAHYFYDRFTQDVDVVVPNMIAMTVDRILAAQTRPKNVGILGSITTTRAGLYDAFLSANGMGTVYVFDSQHIVSEVIEHVKNGHTGEETKQKLMRVIDQLVEHGAEAVVLGCTELSVLVHQDDISVPLFDSNEILATECLAFIKDNAHGEKA